MKSQKADHSRLRWGIMGAGWIAARFAADLRYGTTGRVSQIASRDPARASEMAGRFGASAADSYAALVASDQVDAIYVATPAQLHREHCLLALSHGKPVLCEKPLATNVADAAEMTGLARQKGVVGMVSSGLLGNPRPRSARRGGRGLSIFRRDRFSGRRKRRNGGDYLICDGRRRPSGSRYLWCIDSSRPAWVAARGVSYRVDVAQRCRS